MARVFISHAVKDKSLVDVFFDLLQTGIGLSPDETFCSSLEGMGIPAGANFIDYIKGQVQAPDLMLLILSPNYLDSLFCQCELGAGWVMSHNMIPLVVPPTTYSDLKAVLTGIHAYRIDSDTDLSELRDQVIKLLALSAPKTARWDAKKRKFLEALPNILSNIQLPDRVSSKDHQALQEKYDESVNELKSCLDDIDLLNEQIERLKQCKDKEEVRAVEREFSDNWEQFESLCETAAELSKPLPFVVIEAIYHEMSEKHGVPYGQEIWDAIRDAVQEDYLSVSNDDEVSVNTEDPKVARYMDAANDVARFLWKQDEESSFTTEYIDKYDHRPEFSSRKLWEKHLGLTSFNRW